MEARVAAEGQFDGGSGDGAAHRVGVLVADDEPEQGAGPLLGVGVGVVGAGQLPADVCGRAGPAPLQGVGELLLHELRLGLDVQAREDEHDLVAPAAEPGEPGLERGRRGLAAYAVDADPVRAVGGEPYGVEAGGDVGAGVPGSPVS